MTAKSNKKLRVLGYARVSTDDQVDFGVSLAAQRAKIIAYCKLYDLHLVGIIKGLGESAKSLKRDALQFVLGELDSGFVDGVVIAKLDRLSRSVVDWNTLIEGYFGEKAGRSLFSVADSIDTRTAAGRLVLNVLMSVAQWERETICERTKSALDFKRSKGERVGSVPFGYDLAPDGIMLIENPAEQAVLSLIRELHAGGMSLRRIAAELDRRQLPTKEGRGNWSHTAVQRIVKRLASAV